LQGALRMPQAVMAGNLHVGRFGFSRKPALDKTENMLAGPAVP
jgi:hypothetical protein